MAQPIGAGLAGDFRAPRCSGTRRRADSGEPAPERGDRSPGMAARPGWDRLPPGAMLPGYLPDECPNCSDAGLSAVKPPTLFFGLITASAPAGFSAKPVRSRPSVGFLFE